MKKILFLTMLLISSLLIFACGGSDDSSSGSVSSDVVFVQVEDNEKIYTIDDFINIGYKKGKAVKQDKLMDGMVNAYWGFWKVPYKDWSGKDMIDYELRFFSSHADAVSMGEKSADLRTGENAQIAITRGTDTQLKLKAQDNQTRITYEGGPLFFERDESGTNSLTLGVGGNISAPGNISLINNITASGHISASGNLFTSL